ncbi:MAG: hypothetical protein OXC07_10040 [Kistimonas sp.]|nr:hypothetical protein [Kistimonas sp.]
MNLKRAQQASPVSDLGTAQPAAQRPKEAAAYDKEVIRIYGHKWLLRKTDAQRLYLCPVCFDAAAERTLCGNSAHALCAACFTTMENRNITACPSCKERFLRRTLRSFHDSILEQHQNRILQDMGTIGCAQCGDWSGVQDGMKKHATLCGIQQHPCPWSGAGCTWTGSLEQQHAHGYECDWRTQTRSTDGCAVETPQHQREQEPGDAGRAAMLEEPEESYESDQSDESRASDQSDESRASGHSDESRESDQSDESRASGRSDESRASGRSDEESMDPRRVERIEQCVRQLFALPVAGAPGLSLWERLENSVRREDLLSSLHRALNDEQ